MTIFSKIKGKRGFSLIELTIVMSISIFATMQAKHVIENIRMQSAMEKELDRVKVLYTDFIENINTGYRSGLTYCGNNSYRDISAVRISNCIVQEEYMDPTVVVAERYKTYIHERFFSINVDGGNTNWDSADVNDSYFFRESAIPYKIHIEQSNDVDKFNMYFTAYDNATDKEKRIFENIVYNGFANHIYPYIKGDFPNVDLFTGTNDLKDLEDTDGGIESDGRFMFTIGI